MVLTRADGSKIHNGTVDGAVQDVLDILEDHIAGSADKHDAHDIEITVNTAVDWANGDDWCTSSPVAVDDAIETHVVAKLAGSGATSGAHRIGVYTSTYQSGTVPTLSAGTLFSRLDDLRNGANIYVASMASWPDGTPALNNAASVFDAINTNVITRLGARVSAADQGCRRIGVYGTGYGLASWQALGATTIYGVFVGLNSATGTDGAAYVGAKASGALSAGTVRSQLDNVDSRTTTNASNITALSPRVSEAWGRFSGSSVGAFGSLAIVDHEGITSAIANSLGYIEITFAAAFANTNYSPTATSLESSNLHYYVPSSASLTMTTMRVYVYNRADDSAADPTTGIYAFSIDVKGRR
jgi:hypothetical protein